MHDYLVAPAVAVVVKRGPVTRCEARGAKQAAVVEAPRPRASDCLGELFNEHGERVLMIGWSTMIARRA